MKSRFSNTKHYSRAKEALLKAIKICKTQNELAKKCYVRQQQISLWIKKGVPPAQVLNVEKASLKLVTRHQLRPDIYPLD